MVMLGLAGGVDASKSILYGEAYELFRGVFLPGCSIEDPWDSDAAI
jgi:hypothetical protein